MNKIGVLDSGIGGLAVLKKLLCTIPGEYYYLADTKNFPYGQKTVAELLHISSENIDVLCSYGVTTIVIACHTLCSTIFDDLQQKYPHITFIDIVRPTLQKALSITKNKKIGIMATPATIKSNFYMSSLFNLDPSANLYQQSCPNLAFIIEKFYPAHVYLIEQELRRNYMNIFIQPIDTLILGCTHYEWICKTLEQFIPVTQVRASQEIINSFSGTNFQLHIDEPIEKWNVFFLPPPNGTKKKLLNQLLRAA